MSTLYLHIGGPKTGSTYLQSIFRTNREIPGTYGIHYPQWNEKPETGMSNSYAFSGAQIEIIGRVVAEEIPNLGHPYISPPARTSSALASMLTRAKKLFSFLGVK